MISRNILIMVELGGSLDMKLHMVLMIKDVNMITKVSVIFLNKWFCETNIFRNI